MKFINTLKITSVLLILHGVVMFYYATSEKETPLQTQISAEQLAAVWPILI